MAAAARRICLCRGAAGAIHARAAALIDGTADETAVDRAADGAADRKGPVLLLDHGDNCMSGGSCDVMDVLEELLAAGHDGILVGPIADPETVARLFAAGAGAQVTISLGNKSPAEGLLGAAPAAQAQRSGGGALGRAGTSAARSITVRNCRWPRRSIPAGRRRM